MKTILTATLLFIPCLLVLNESNTFVPNILGFAYISVLFAASRTEKGKKFIKKLYKENERITNILFK